MLNLITFSYEEEETQVLWNKKRDEFAGCGRETCLGFGF